MIVEKDELKDCWQEQMRAIDCKYFVIKADDLFNSISNDQALEFSNMLADYNDYREKNLGKGVNRYFVANRDEFPQLADAHEFINFLNYCIENHLDEFKNRIKDV